MMMMRRPTQALSFDVPLSGIARRRLIQMSFRDANTSFRFSKPEKKYYKSQQIKKKSINK